MGYSDPDEQRKYQREWIAKRRTEWFKDHPCVDCGATTGLQLDHVNLDLKVSHRIWSWKLERRLAELAKCVSRCRPCHVGKTSARKEQSQPGVLNRGAKLTEEQVLEIYARRMYGDETGRALASEFGVSPTSISAICTGRKWKYLGLRSSVRSRADDS